MSGSGGEIQKRRRPHVQEGGWAALEIPLKLGKSARQYAK